MPCEFFSAECPWLAPFPPKRRQDWLDSVLREMASHRAVTSRGKRNIRGVKKRTSNYGARKRGDPINQPCSPKPVSYTHLRAHETRHDLVCRLLLEKKKNKEHHTQNHKPQNIHTQKWHKKNLEQ